MVRVEELRGSAEGAGQVTAISLAPDPLRMCLEDGDLPPSCLNFSRRLVIEDTLP